MFKLLVVIALLLLTAIIIFPAAYAEDVITIIPCSSNHNNPKFFDLTSDYVQKGQQVRWFNADDINHRIVINTSDRKQVVADSGLIKPNSSFSFQFNNPGIYDFSSPIYPWMKGNVSVTDELSSEIRTNPKNNVDVQLSWNPATPKVGQLTHFKIVFLHNNTSVNQPHIDYVFSIINSTNKTVYQQGLHSSWGVESASYKFNTTGFFTPKVTITAVLFQPVEPTESDFKIHVTA
jgi:plastocyanin